MAMIHDLNRMKSQAKNLRAALERAGNPVSHSQALELVAQSHGARDWNTAHASAETAPLWQFGGAVKGRYLGQEFTGRVIAASERGPKHHALTIAGDQRIGTGNRLTKLFRIGAQHLRAGLIGGDAAQLL